MFRKYSQCFVIHSKMNLFTDSEDNLEACYRWLRNILYSVVVDRDCFDRDNPSIGVWLISVIQSAH